jgi:hypothetical protein
MRGRSRVLPPGSRGLRLPDNRPRSWSFEILTLARPSSAGGHLRLVVVACGHALPDHAVRRVGARHRGRGRADRLRPADRRRRPGLRPARRRRRPRLPGRARAGNRSRTRRRRRRLPPAIGQARSSALALPDDGHLLASVTSTEAWIPAVHTAVGLRGNGGASMIEYLLAPAHALDIRSA